MSEAQEQELETPKISFFTNIGAFICFSTLFLILPFFLSLKLSRISSFKLNAALSPYFENYLYFLALLFILKLSSLFTKKLKFLRYELAFVAVFTFFTYTFLHIFGFLEFYHVSSSATIWILAFYFSTETVFFMVSLFFLTIVHHNYSLLLVKKRNSLAKNSAAYLNGDLYRLATTFYKTLAASLVFILIHISVFSVLHWSGYGRMSNSISYGTPNWFSISGGVLVIGVFTFFFIPFFRVAFYLTCLNIIARNNNSRMASMFEIVGFVFTSFAFLNTEFAREFYNDIFTYRVTSWEYFWSFKFGAIMVSAYCYFLLQGRVERRKQELLTAQKAD